jgi:hypothetical protein
LPIEGSIPLAFIMESLSALDEDEPEEAPVEKTKEKLFT